MEILEKIINHPIMKQVISDSFGGCMYDVSNQNKYDGKEKDELLTLWYALSPSEQDVSGGIIKGAIDFLQGN